MTIEWAQYADTTIRETYTPLPNRGGDPNKEASESVVGALNARYALARRDETAFRARQRARRLQTRGLAAMRDPEEVAVVTPPVALPDLPDLDPYKAAGWLG